MAADTINNLNWGIIQLGLVVLVFAGLQIWWIGSILRRRPLARPMTSAEFRNSLNRIWSKKV